MAMKVTAHGHKVAARLTVMRKKTSSAPAPNATYFPVKKKKNKKKVRAFLRGKLLVSLILQFPVSFSVAADSPSLASFTSAELL